MNKTYNVNIGGYAFVMDQDAYHHLENYFKDIDRHFRGTEGHEDITDDIELRMAELLNDRKNKRPIVNMDNVVSAIEILGTPKDFVAEENENHTYSETHSTHRSSESGPRRKYFRDIENKKIGGVIAGICNFYGIENVTLVRLICLVAALGSGGGIILLYVALWAIVPKPKTPIDEMMMRGEPINLETISRRVQEGAQTISDQLDKLNDKLNKK